MLPQINNREYVILLHGMARTKYSMSKLEKHLVKNGYNVINTGYPSTSETVETMAEKYLGDMVDDCLQKGASKIHIVTHSLGGIVTRLYLQNHTPERRPEQPDAESTSSQNEDALGNDPAGLSPDAPTLFPSRSNSCHTASFHPWHAQL